MNAQQKERYEIYTGQIYQEQQPSPRIFLTQHIGSTTYRVQIRLAQEGNGTLEDKLIRINVNGWKMRRLVVR